jgi:hypothetical protein
MEFAATVFAFIWNNRISVTLENNDHKEAKAWEDVLNALLSGVLVCERICCRTYGADKIFA